MSIKSHNDMKQEYMIQDMKRIMTRLCVLTLLLLVSMTAGAKVEVLLDDYKGGTIKVKSQADNDDGSTTVTITVTPNQGYTITRKGLTVIAVYPTTSQSGTRAAPEQGHQGRCLHDGTVPAGFRHSFR